VLVLMGTAAENAQAAWNNVFQVCCNSCRKSYYSNSCCTPCCPPACTTQYVQRCYYQPVTCYQTRTYYEPVTTYRTSYYYEPVTSYRYSCYYDPCTCCYQQVACPTTSYVLRAQTCAVQSWVQRCCQVPVTTYQQSCYWEPVTTCCSPCCTPCCNGSAPAVTERNGTAPAGAAPPTVTEQRPAPQATENPPATGAPPTLPSYKAPEGTSFRPAAPQAPARPRTPPVPPTVRLDRIVSLQGGTNAQVQGQIVRQDHSPRPGAHVMFVNAGRPGPSQTVTADGHGQFRVTLASGGWLVYVQGADGKPIFHSKIDVQADEMRQLTLVSR
jgi:hypothetical protein